MAKSAERRHHAKRLHNKWVNLMRHLDPDRSLDCVKFGRIYSTDPMDCGRPNCGLCAHRGVTKGKEQRSLWHSKAAKELRDFLRYLDS